MELSSACSRMQRLTLPRGSKFIGQCGVLQIPDLFRKAWEVQVTGVPTVLKDVDVDKECLESLEEEMFENTDRTGVSGNEQWGLDVGHHQGGWNPYIDAPKLWDGKKREGNEGELEVRLTWN